VNVGFELTGNFEEALTGDVNVVEGTAVAVTGAAVPGEDYTFTPGSFSALLLWFKFYQLRQTPFH
jgi:hypothetical protein